MVHVPFIYLTCQSQFFPFPAPPSLPLYSTTHSPLFLIRKVQEVSHGNQPNIAYQVEVKLSISSVLRLKNPESIQKESKTAPAAIVRGSTRRPDYTILTYIQKA